MYFHVILVSDSASTPSVFTSIKVNIHLHTPIYGVKQTKKPYYYNAEVRKGFQTFFSKTFF